MIAPLAALSVASQVLQPQAAPPAAAAPAVGAVSFEDALSQAFGAAVDTLKTGEATAIQSVQGGVPAMRVVESVMDAQRSLQSVLAIRDKLVTAWQDISRISI